MTEHHVTRDAAAVKNNVPVSTFKDLKAEGVEPMDTDQTWEKSNFLKTLSRSGPLYDITRGSAAPRDINTHDAAVTSSKLAETPDDKLFVWLQMADMTSVRILE